MARWRHIKQGKKPKEAKPAPSFTPAPIADRLKAFLTDTFMITMPILYIVIYLIMGSREAFRDHMAQGWLYILIPHFLIVVLLWWKKAETPGMRAYEIKIVKYNDPNTPIAFWQAVLRYLLMPISILSIIGVVIAFFRKDRQTFHDLASWTMLIRNAS